MTRRRLAHREAAVLVRQEPVDRRGHLVEVVDEDPRAAVEDGFPQPAR
jgi:hypothetical protein